MLGFGKKKKKKSEEDAGGQVENASASDSATENLDQESESLESGKAKRKKRLPIKKLVFILLALVAIGASAFVVYYFYFSGKGSDEDKPVYKSIPLEHVTLPEEILQFSFEYLPDVYSAFKAFNSEIILMSAEIERIDAIGQQYPDQKKIADKEKKVWEKTKSVLEKAFLKIEKSVKETYVLYRVNKASGTEQIKVKYPEIADTAKAALKQAQEMTQSLKSENTVPDGFIKGNIYKLKKKFL